MTAPAGRGDDVADDVLGRLRALADPTRLPGMARYGIATEHALGITVVELRTLARELGRDPGLATALWATGVHEARILASMVADPDRFDEAEMERWAAGFDSWDLCDQVCANLFRWTPLAWSKAAEWTAREEPLVKRAGFSLIAGLAVADKRADDARFTAVLPLIARGAEDERPLVRKGVSWALRSIGKRNAALNARAVEVATALREDRRTRWVGADALRELAGDAVRRRLSGRPGGRPGGRSAVRSR